MYSVNTKCWEMRFKREEIAKYLNTQPIKKYVQIVIEKLFDISSLQKNTTYYTCINITKTKNTYTTKCWQYMQLPELSDIAGRGKKIHITLENSLELSYKVKYLPVD